MRLETIGVIGAGVMGVGVAQNLAQSGFEVILIDISRQVLDEAKAQIRQNLRLQMLLGKEAAQASSGEVIKRIDFSEELSRLESADYVIENVTEKWEIKRELYKRIEAVCPPPCVFAANTSAIPITRIASATGRADRVIGIHFMNPVPMKKTVEVIRGFHTSDATIATTAHLLAAMGKEWVMVNDAPGFVSNRVLMLTINEAIYLVQDGVATPEAVDQIFRDCFGHKMGPLETADLIGLDTILLSVEVLYESFSDSKYRPCPRLRQMVDAGLLGRKSGKGFYTYGPGQGLG
ncbi:MAG TPA: 3-hydroxyacyl-CoA dehydrogenase NAD-binding domain-containing protein [Blastocatellia bacterium]|nr:3-hydroxyacyl-CoA dehydrogenase NAD-binding domain-containing protein [Blastocatellia bacterium]